MFDDPKGKAPVNGIHTLEKAEVNQPSTIAVFECRGCEFVDFEPRVGLASFICEALDGLTVFSFLKGTWKCKGAESGIEFDDVEFEDGRWDEYDEKVRMSNDRLAVLQC